MAAVDCLRYFNSLMKVQMQSLFICSLRQPTIWSHRCSWRMSTTKLVGDKPDVLITNFIVTDNLANEILQSIITSWSKASCWILEILKNNFWQSDKKYLQLFRLQIAYSESLFKSKPLGPSKFSTKTFFNKKNQLTTFRLGITIRDV